MWQILFADKTRLNLNPSQFIPGLDIPMMYREMYWASEGYLWEMVQQGNVDIENCWLFGKAFICVRSKNHGSN